MFSNEGYRRVAHTSFSEGWGFAGECRRRVTRFLTSLAQKNIVGAPSFARFAKGGNLERMRDRLQSHKNRVGSIVTRPCKKRKDGAPSAPMAHTDIIKKWPPAQRSGPSFQAPPRPLAGGWLRLLTSLAPKT